MKLYIIILCGLVFGLAACKNTLPPSTEGEASFQFDGSIDGEAVLIEAGKEGMQLNGTYFRDGVGVDVYAGEFSPLTCEGCPGSLRISIRGREIRSSQMSASPTCDLVVGNVDFVGGKSDQSDPKAFRFRAITKGIHPIKHEWMVEGKPIEGHDAIFHRFEATGHQPVTLRTTDARGCSNQTEFRVPAGQGFCGDPFRFAYEKKGNGTVKFSAPVAIPSVNILNVTWNMGDGRIITSDLQPEYTYPRPGIYPVKVIILDSNGCLHCDFQNVYSEPGISCESSILALPVAPNGEAGKVTIQWWDAAGREFNSDHINPQPSDSFFEILSVAPWEDDPDGTPTWRVEARLRCRLYAGDGSADTMELESEKLIFAVGVE
jgi:hypothetical protein